MPSSLIGNFFWKFSEQVGAQAVAFVVTVVLARILAPSDYGAVAMVTVFISLATVFVDGGFNSALIQKKNADILDFSTVFYFSLAFAIFLYVILWISAPYISDFYGKDYTILTPVLRVLGLQLIFYAINSVQQAYVARQMMFRIFFWATLIGTIISGIIGLSMAYMGLGVWALVGQAISSGVVNILTLYLITKKRPALMFSFTRLKSLLDYGIKLFGAGLLISVFQQIRALVIGKLYTPADLAFYDRGRQYPYLVVNNLNTSIGAVLFPKMSQEQDELGKLKTTTRNSIRFSSYLMCPMMIGLTIVAEPFIRLLLTEKWVPCVPLLQLFCIIYLFQPIHTANLQAIKALGRSDTFLKLEVIKRIIDMVALISVMWISVKAIVVSMAVVTTFFTFINAHPNKKLLGYSFMEQMKDIFSPLMMSLFMVIPHIFLIMSGCTNDWVIIIFDILAGGLIYIGLSYITHNKEFEYILSLVTTRLKH